MLAAAVLFDKQHPTNQFCGDQQLLGLAKRVGDRVASDSESDPAENRQDYEWEIHFWLDAFRLLETHLTPTRRDRWQAAIERNIRWFAGQVDAGVSMSKNLVLSPRR